MLNIIKAATLIASLTMLGCASQPPPKVDYDAAHDFSTYRTFAWLSDRPMKVGPIVSDPQDSLEPQIMAAIRSNLEGRGFQFADASEAADFLVSFTVGSREKMRPTGYPSMQPGAGGRWGWGTEYHHGEEGASYTQGVLAIDIFDAAERRPVWHGVTGRRMDDTSRDDMPDLIRAVVATIFKDFPPDEGTASK